MSRFDPEKFSRDLAGAIGQMKDAMLNLSMQLSTSAAMVWVLQGKPDEARKILNEMDEDELLVISIAAHALRDLTDEVLSQHRS